MFENENENGPGTDVQLFQAQASPTGSATIPRPELRKRKPTGLKAGPRLHHKKSRTGCHRCRTRRVKVRCFR